MAVHVRFESLYISLSSSANQRREMTKFCVVGERGPPRLNFKIFISYLSLCFALSFEIVLTVINIVNDSRVSRDS